MTLDELVEEYSLENYKLFFGKDRHGKTINQWFIFDNHEEYLDKYLGFYKNMEELTEAIIYATDGFFKLSNRGVEFFIRHGHQSEYKDKKGQLKGIKPSILSEVRNNLIRNIDVFRAVKKFDQVIEVVNSARISGFGELAVYDTSLRIGSFLNIEPDAVYLHAGSRDGCRSLEVKGYLPTGSSELSLIHTNFLPKILQNMKPASLEHFFCAAKDRLKEITPLKFLY